MSDAPRLSRFSGPPGDWDRFAEAQPGFTHFHRFGWKRIIENAFGHECLYLVATRDGDAGIDAILPLVRVNSALFGHYLVSMPFLNYGGPLGSPAGIRLLAQAAVEEAEQSGARLLELRSRIALPLELPVSHRKLTVLLDLPATPDLLLRGFPAKLRSQVRRSEKEGITMRFGHDQVDPFFQVFSHHMRDLGTPTLPLRFFRAIAGEFGDHAWFGCAWLGDRPIGCGAGFQWGGEFEMTWASSLIAYNAKAPNMFLYWNFMARAIQQGIRTFNFGRCTPDSGTHRFKRQWGSRDQPLWWYQWPPKGSAESATPSPDQGKYSWGPRLWRHLPLPASRWLGPRIVKYIP